jgi:hypothetical protein
LYLFAAMFKLQREDAGEGVIRVPGGKPMAKLIACVGFATTTVTILLSLVPSPDETNKVLATVKVVGLTGLLLAGGALFYFMAKRKQRQAPA